MAPARRCTGINRDGSPCSAAPRADRPHCVWHDPELAAKRQADRSAGGRARSNQARAKKRIIGSGLDLAQVDRALCRALLDVLDGKLDPPLATAAATLARAIVATRSAGDLEARISALEGRGGRTA